MRSEDKGKPVWFITGCSKGLGRALAEHVLAQGHRCIVTARDIDSIQPLIAGRTAHQAVACPLDVTKPRQVEDAVRRAEQAFGGVDVLVNNAGFGYGSSVEEGDEQHIRNLFDTNFFGLAALTRAVLPMMRAR